MPQRLQIKVVHKHFCVILDTLDDDYALAIQLQMEEEQLYRSAHAKEQRSSKRFGRRECVTSSPHRPTHELRLLDPRCERSTCGGGA